MNFDGQWLIQIEQLLKYVDVYDLNHNALIVCLSRPLSPPFLSFVQGIFGINSLYIAYTCHLIQRLILSVLANLLGPLSKEKLPFFFHGHIIGANFYSWKHDSEISEQLKRRFGIFGCRWLRNFYKQPKFRCSTFIRTFKRSGVTEIEHFNGNKTFSWGCSPRCFIFPRMESPHLKCQVNSLRRFLSPFYYFFEVK